MQKLVDAVYSVFSKVFGGKDYRNGRKFFISCMTITLLFVCAIFVEGSLKFLTDTVFMTGLVTVLGLYFGSNTLSKKFNQSEPPNEPSVAVVEKTVTVEKTEVTKKEPTEGTRCLYPSNRETA